MTSILLTFKHSCAGSKSMTSKQVVSGCSEPAALFSIHRLHESDAVIDLVLAALLMLKNFQRGSGPTLPTLFLALILPALYNFKLHSLSRAHGVRDVWNSFQEITQTVI